MAGARAGNVPASARSGQLETVVRSLAPGDAAAVRSWLGALDGEHLNPRALIREHEPAGSDVPRPAADEPRAIRTVGVIGGGTAGYLTALALRTTRPWLDVALVESKNIPIIGVGEATVPGMVAFLHHFIGVEPAEFYRQVEPTWKLGIKFLWGPDADGFTAPFDWGHHSIGGLGALQEQGTINGFSLGSLLMMSDRTPVLDIGGQPVSLMKYLPFAYHLDNGRFVRYLTGLAARRGVRHVDATVAETVLSGDDWIDYLRTTDGQELRYDFYVDCTGFRSLLMGKALGVPFESYASSLFTDSAITVNRDHGGRLKPYTTATTMDAGWCWTIPVPESDHLGYVYSSAAISDDQAAAELRRCFPGAGEPKQVRFRSGRHALAWQGNVMAIGNSYAFVEPLESTGLLMITSAIRILAASLPATWSRPLARDAVNASLARRWDGLRWFLAIHYRYNTRKDTPFWKQARSQADVSGLQPVLDLFASGAPLNRRQPAVRRIASEVAPLFYGLAGIDNILLGQHVPTQLMPTAEPARQWRARKRAAEALLRQALPQREALSAFAAHPDLLRQLHEDPDSWAAFDRP
jgi:tryptophan halogenase